MRRVLSSAAAFGSSASSSSPSNLCVCSSSSSSSSCIHNTTIISSVFTRRWYLRRTPRIISASGGSRGDDGDSGVKRRLLKRVGDAAAVADEKDKMDPAVRAASRAKMLQNALKGIFPSSSQKVGIQAPVGSSPGNNAARATRTAPKTATEGSQLQSKSSDRVTTNRDASALRKKIAEKGVFDDVRIGSNHVDEAFSGSEPGKRAPRETKAGLLFDINKKAEQRRKMLNAAIAQSLNVLDDEESEIHQLARDETSNKVRTRSEQKKTVQEKKKPMMPAADAHHAQQQQNLTMQKQRTATNLQSSRDSATSSSTSHLSRRDSIHDEQEDIVPGEHISNIDTNRTLASQSDHDESLPETFRSDERNWSLSLPANLTQQKELEVSKTLQVRESKYTPNQLAVAEQNRVAALKNKRLHGIREDTLLAFAEVMKPSFRVTRPSPIEAGKEIKPRLEKWEVVELFAARRKAEKERFEAVLHDKSPLNVVIFLAHQLHQYYGLLDEFYRHPTRAAIAETTADGFKVEAGGRVLGMLNATCVAGVILSGDVLCRKPFSPVRRWTAAETKFFRTFKFDEEQRVIADVAHRRFKQRIVEEAARKCDLGLKLSQARWREIRAADHDDNEVYDDIDDQSQLYGSHTASRSASTASVADDGSGGGGSDVNVVDLASIAMTYLTNNVDRCHRQEQKAIDERFTTGTAATRDVADDDTATTSSSSPTTQNSTHSSSLPEHDHLGRARKLAKIILEDNNNDRYGCEAEHDAALLSVTNELSTAAAHQRSTTPNPADDDQNIIPKSRWGHQNLLMGTKHSLREMQWVLRRHAQLFGDYKEVIFETRIAPKFRDWIKHRILSSIDNEGHEDAKRRAAEAAAINMKTSSSSSKKEEKEAIRQEVEGEGVVATTDKEESGNQQSSSTSVASSKTQTPTASSSTATKEGKKSQQKPQLTDKDVEHIEMTQQELSELLIQSLLSGLWLLPQDVDLNHHHRVIADESYSSHKKSTPHHLVQFPRLMYPRLMLRYRVYLLGLSMLLDLRKALDGHGKFLNDGVGGGGAATAGAGEQQSGSSSDNAMVALTDEEFKDPNRLALNETVSASRNKPVVLSTESDGMHEDFVEAFHRMEHLLVGPTGILTKAMLAAESRLGQTMSTTASAASSGIQNSQHQQQQIGDDKWIQELLLFFDSSGPACGTTTDDEQQAAHQETALSKSRYMDTIPATGKTQKATTATKTATGTSAGSNMGSDTTPIIDLPLTDFLRCGVLHEEEEVVVVVADTIQKDDPLLETTTCTTRTTHPPTHPRKEDLHEGGVEVEEMTSAIGGRTTPPPRPPIEKLTTKSHKKTDTTTGGNTTTATEDDDPAALIA